MPWRWRESHYALHKARIRRRQVSELAFAVAQPKGATRMSVEMEETLDKLLPAQQETNRLMEQLLAIAQKWEARLDELAERRRLAKETAERTAGWHLPKTHR